MSSVLSSPRRRRRLVWVCVLVLAIGAVVGVALATRQSVGKEKPARSSAPAPNPAAERTVRLAAADRRRIKSLIARFVATAVVQHKAASYDLVTPAFRAGTTRAQWARADTPVYRYPAEPGSAKCRSPCWCGRRWRRTSAPQGGPPSQSIHRSASLRSSEL